MNHFYEIIQKSLGLSITLQLKIFYTLLTLAALIIVRLIVVKIIWSKTDDVRTRYIWRKSLIYLLSIIGILILSNIWFHGLRNVGTFLGLLSAGIAIALKDPVVDVAGWLFIMARRPFSIGDRIQIGEHIGDVIDLRVFQFSLMEVSEQSTGRVIHIPNGMVFTTPVANFNQGFGYIWNEIPVLITFESDWRKAKNILLNIASIHAAHLSGSAEAKIKAASNKFMISYTKLTPIVYTSVQDSGILLTIRYLCSPLERRTTSEAIWEDILDEFARYPDIDFAYPTTRFYNHQSEGKTTK